MIDTLNLTDEQKTALQEHINKLESDAMERAKNDSEYIKQIKKNGYGEALTKVQKSVLKSFGLSKEEIKDIEDDFEKQLELGISKLNTQKDSTNIELQNKLVEYQNEVAKYKDEVIPSIKNEYESKFTQRIINEKSLISIADAKDNLIIEPSVFKTLFDSQLHELGIVLSIHDEKVDIKKTDGLFFYDGTKKIDSLSELILFVAKKTKTLKESNGGASGGQGGSGAQGGGQGSKKVEIGNSTKAMAERFGITI